MIHTPHELFAYRLRTMLWVEQRLVEKILPTLYDHVHSTELKYAIEHHTFETRQHVRILQRALHLLGQGAEPVESPALTGLEAEHDELMRIVDQGREDVVDLMHAEVIAAGEHQELAAYESLVATANALGEEEIASLLEEVREQEEHALEITNEIAVKLLAEKVESERLGLNT
jgi:ferritin-like metal-binding protein YciE